MTIHGVSKLFVGVVDLFFKESGEVLIIETVSSWILSLGTLNKIVVVSGILDDYGQMM